MTSAAKYSCLRFQQWEKKSVLYKSKCFYKAKFQNVAKYCQFYTFCKGYSEAKWFRHELSSDQPTRWRLIRPHVKETGTCEHCHVFTWHYAIHFIPTNLVRNKVRGNLRMRKQNTKTTVPLDAVPERRTKRFPPRFRPVGRFCELRFRYLSSPIGREGEISRPLDHVRQIPFIHSARLIDSTNFYIYRTVFYIFSPYGTLRCVLM